MNIFNNKRGLFLLFCLVLGVFSVVFSFFLMLEGDNDETKDVNISKIVIGDNIFNVEPVVTKEERVRGLSGREYLPQDTVMLFIFDNEDYHGIWMKDMHFSIDIVWLDKEKKVVGYKKGASPESFPDVFSVEKPSLYIIEGNEGFVEENSINLGDVVVFK